MRKRKLIAFIVAFIAVPFISSKVREQFWEAFVTVAGQRIADMIFSQPQPTAPPPPMSPVTRSSTGQRPESLSVDDPLTAILTCASGANIELSADLVGSIRTIFNGEGTKGYASFKTESEFLEQFPDSQRLQAYTLYVQCVATINRK
jgi:hypothetical protein